MRKAVVIPILLLSTLIPTLVQAQKRNIFDSKSPIVGATFNISNEYELNEDYYTPGLDINVAIILLNIGYRYSTRFKTFYLGLGIGSIFQLQGGFDFRNQVGITSIRSDFPWLAYIDKDLDYINIGIKLDYAFGEENDKSSEYSGYRIVAINVGIKLGYLWYTIFPSKKGI